MSVQLWIAIKIGPIFSFRAGIGTALHYVNLKYRKHPQWIRNANLEQVLKKHGKNVKSNDFDNDLTINEFMR